MAATADRRTVRGVHGRATVLCLGAMACGAMAEEVRLYRAVEARPEIPGAPAAADVCMRSLRPRPINARDPHNTLDAMRGFHVTWLEWTYGNDREFIRQVHALGATFGGALAAGSYAGDEPRETWNVRDREGTPVYATWMRAWKRPNPWGCANHPEFRAGHVRAAIAAVEAGADVLQRDEPGQNKHALRWGGCFCDYCMTGFRQWLAENGDPDVLERLGVTDPATFDYRDYLRDREAPVGDDFGRWRGDELKTWFERFQVESSVSFNRWWREELNRHFGRRIPVSCNNGVHAYSDIELEFDYWIGELSMSRAKPDLLHAAMRKAASFGRTQSVTMPLRRTGEQESPDWVRHTRQTIATVYAAGGHIEMPWDTYLPTPDAQRYFGKPENYADLTAFVRGMARFLNGYEDAFAGGADIVDARWPSTPPVTLLTDSPEVCVFARALPGAAEAPVAVHLVDWRDEPRSFRVSLRPQAFFGSRPLRLRLFTPVLPYDRDTHDTAFRTGEYSRLIREVELASGYTNAVDIPALDPWGVLVVDPLPEEPGGMWPPSFLAYAPDFYTEMDVALDCATPGAAIHYTLDGSPPSADSPRYAGPIVLREAATVSAVSIRDGVTSAPVSARFTKRERPPSLIANGDFEDGLEGWRRVVFPEAGDDALDVSVDTDGRLLGAHSARMFMRNPTGTVYHLRLVHPFDAKPGTEYTLSFRAVADGSVRCRVGLQALNAPHKVLGMKMEQIGTVPRRFSLKGRGLRQDDAREYLVQFDVGAAENAGRALWIDDVLLVEAPEPDEP